jgi:glutaredoxin-like protein NrdH
MFLDSMNERNGMMQIPVRLYSLSTCSHCRCTKELLSNCGVKYDCTDVDKVPKDEVTAILDEVKQLNARCSFPTIVIGDKVIVGYKEDEIKEALGV